MIPDISAGADKRPGATRRRTARCCRERAESGSLQCRSDRQSERSMKSGEREWGRYIYLHFCYLKAEDTEDRK